MWCTYSDASSELHSLGTFWLQVYFWNEEAKIFGHVPVSRRNLVLTDQSDRDLEASNQHFCNTAIRTSKYFQSPKCPRNFNICFQSHLGYFCVTFWKMWRNFDSVQIVLNYGVCLSGLFFKLHNQFIDSLILEKYCKIVHPQLRTRWQ